MSRHRRSPGFRDSYSPNNRNENNSRNTNDRSNQRLIRSLCFSNIPQKISDNSLAKIFDKDFARFGEFQVNISQFSGERVVYLNFRRPEEALIALERMDNYELEGRRINIRPIYITNNNRRSSPPNRKSRSPPSRYRQSSTYNHSPFDNEKPSRSASPDHNVPTRTLFIGNLSIEIDEPYLYKKFEKYGDVRNVDIKRSQKSNQQYAFIRFNNVDMAMRAKHELDGEVNYGLPMKIGYGKQCPSLSLCVGGLGPWLTFEDLEKEVMRSPGVTRINWPKNRNHAYVVYQSQAEAAAALDHLRSVKVGDKRLKVDYCDFVDSQSSKPKPSAPAPSSRRSPSRRSPSRPPTLERARTISMVADCLKPVWSGKLLLRNSKFSCRLSRLRGDASLVEECLQTPLSSPRPPSLSITRSMPLRTLTDIRAQMDRLHGKHYCLLLATPYVISTTLLDDALQQQQPLRLLVDYLRSRACTGVVMLPGNCVVHVVPPCDTVIDLLLDKAPSLSRKTVANDDDFVLVLLLNRTSVAPA